MNQDIEKIFRQLPALFALLLVALLVIYGISGFYVVKPEERGVLKRFGAIIADDVPPGIHYRLPWPFESVLLLKTTEIKTLRYEFTGYPVAENIGGELLTGDENLLQASVLLQYTISEPKAYLRIALPLERLLQQLTAQAAIQYFAQTAVDGILTSGRQQLQSQLLQALRQQVQVHHLGISIVALQWQSLEAPESVQAAFNDVASAREDKQRLIQDAAGYRNRRLPEARAQAMQIRRQAQGYASELLNQAQGEAQRFQAQWEEYRHNKETTAFRLYIETMEQVLPKVNTLVAPIGELAEDFPVKN